MTRAPTFRQRTVGAYVAVLVTLVTVTYGLQFQSRAALIDSCQRVNELRVQTNDRVRVFREIATVLIAARTGSDAIVRDQPAANAREVRRLRDLQRKVGSVPLADCQADFPPPFPFG